MKNYYTYIAQCGDTSYYIGQTQNLIKRLRQHNGTLRGGARYTHYRRPVILRYYEQHATRIHAMQREIALKKLSRKHKEALCDAFFISINFIRNNE